jgi:hypothetical protein
MGNKHYDSDEGGKLKNIIVICNELECNGIKCGGRHNKPHKFINEEGECFSKCKWLGHNGVCVPVSVMEKEKKMNKPLFIPLRTEYYDEFKNGTKDTEYRLYGPRWNERVCQVGRNVIISRGYFKKNRMQGIITDFRKVPIFKSAGRAAFVEIYGADELGPVAEIVIKIIAES